MLRPGATPLDQRAHQRARQRGVAVREMVDVGGLVLGVAARLVLDPQRLGARKALAHRIERADGVDAVAEVVARAALEEVGGVGRQLADVGEERAVAGLGEGRDLLLRSIARPCSRAPPAKRSDRPRRAGPDRGQSARKASMGRAPGLAGANSSKPSISGSPVTSRSSPKVSRSKNTDLDRPSLG